jgi:hypothetical protein
VAKATAGEVAWAARPGTSPDLTRMHDWSRGAGENSAGVRSRGASPTVDRGRHVVDGRPEPRGDRRLSPSAACRHGPVPRNPPPRMPTVLAFSKPGTRRRIQSPYSDRGSQKLAQVACSGGAARRGRETGGGCELRGSRSHLNPDGPAERVRAATVSETKKKRESFPGQLQAS